MKAKMKRLYLIILTFTMLLSFTACNSNSAPTSNDEYASQEDFLKDMAKGISNRLKNVDDEKTRTTDEMASYQANVVSYELEQILKYEDSLFSDKVFNDLAHTYIAACKTQKLSADNYKNSNIYPSLWDAGSNIRKSIISELYSRYNLPITSEEAAHYSGSSSGVAVTYSMNGEFDFSTGRTLYSDNMKTYDTIKLTKNTSQVLFNDENIKITLKSIEIEHSNYVVKVSLSNNSDQNVCADFSSGYVDEYQINIYSPVGGPITPAGKKSDTYAHMTEKELADINKLNFKTLYFNMYVITTNDDSTGQIIAKIPLEISRSAFN